MYIIHGDDIGQSRKKLDELLFGRENITRIDGKKIKSDEVQMLFASTELFAIEKTIVIENCKAIAKQAFEKLIDACSQSDHTLILWQAGNYDARLIKKFKDAQVFTFPLPKYYFIFLDSLAPKKGKQLHDTYTKLLDTFVPEQVFFSMIKRIRHLLILSSDISHEFEEIAKMNSWQKSKLESQMRMWDAKTLQSFYAKLYDTEMRMKTSSLPINLEKHIDILLLSELH